MSIRKRKSLINIIRQDKALVILASLLCLIIIHLLFYSILLYKEAGAALQILILPTPTPTPIQFVVPNNLLVPPQPISTPTPTPTPSQGILPLGTTAPQETVTPLAEPQPTPTPPVRGTPVVSPPNPTPTPVVNSPTFTPSPVVTPTATPTPVVAPIAAPTPSPTPQVAPVAVPTPDAAQSASVGLLSVLEGYEIIDFIKQTIFYNSGLKKLIEKIIVPSLVIIALLNTFPSILATGINLRIWLHLLFVEPFLWLFKKRREKWNVVYDALSKRPVDLAVVRLYDKKNNKIIQEKVTDGNGRYLLRVNENGEYYLTAQKTGYVYPSRLLKGRTQDNKYSYLYFGKEIKLAEQGGDIVVDIPLDPVEKKLKSANWLIGEYWLKNFRLAVSYSGIILAVVAVIIVPTVITISCLILHVILLWIFRRLNVAPKIKNWGVIYDQENKAPLVHAIVRIFDLEFNRLVANQLTDAQGKYAFLVGENKFQVLAEKPDYEKKIIKPVDLTGKKQIIDLDIGLKKNN